MDSLSNEIEEISLPFEKNTLLTYSHTNIIGWGSFSFNYKGQLVSKKQLVKEIAIKEIKLNSLIDPYNSLSLQSALNEINILKQIKHKHVIKFIGFQKFDDASRLVILQKLCNQGDLAKFLTNNQFMSQNSIIYFFNQIVKGFKYLISQKVFHGDIKPENLFLHNDKIKIADFGMSMKLKTLNDTFTETIGSPGYMSPEILNGEEYTIQSDIWSLGITLYYMIYEQLPWEDKKNPIKLSKYLKELNEKKVELVTFPENWRFQVSAEFKAMIRKMIAYDPKERLTWNELFKMKFNEEKQKKGPMNLLYKRREKKNANKGTDNYCSPLLLLDENKNEINKIKVCEYPRSKFCKAGI